MSKLADLYEASKTPVDDRIQSEKNILLVVPDKKHDIGPVLSYLGLSPFEVALTWPKKTVDAIDEIDAVGAKVVLQVDCSLTRKRHSINTQDLKSLDPYRESVREAIADRFVCLHHHDEFSIKDGLGTIGSFDFKKKQWKGLLGLLKAQRRSFCCITNHGSVGGWIKQYNACKKAGVKALFGMEAYTSNYRGDDPEMKKAHRSANHLVLIANNEEGFFNIIRIHNDAQLNGFYYTPRVNREALEKWGKGIIGMSACMAGELPRLLMEGKDTEAKEFWEFHSRVFDAFYIEIQIIEAEEQREANRRLIQFARSVGAPLVLSCDSHYLDPEYAETHDMLMCLRQKKTIMDKREKDDVWSFDVRNLYYRDAAAMRQVFENGYVTEDGTQHAPFLDDVFTEDVFNEAIANTRKIAIETQNIKLDATIKLPKLHENGKEVLRKKLNIGFSARGLAKKPNADEYFKRIKSEFEAITKMGWGDYFLIMERIITDTKEKYGEWAIGYGRGSAAGSLVSYCLGLTGIDPIEYGLLFERFLEEGRPDPPDIDTDFDPRIRDWVKQHIVEVFGANNVCSIGTYQSYKTRAVILDVARALGENLAEVNAVTKRIEPLRAFEDDSGEEFKVDQMEFDDICEHYPELKTYFEAHPEVRRHAEILRNQVKNMGTHAGGVIISDLDLRDRIPVLYDKPSSENRQVISAWAESGSVQELSSVGLVKYDILGLNNLPVISDCVRLIEQTTGVKLPREEIPISDREAIFLGSKRDMVGIFQFENPVTKPIADKVGMESLMDIAVVTSLIRPGPMDAMIGDKRAPFAYAARKHGEPYEAPEFIRYALKETYGIMVFQEDVMRLSKVLSGFSAAEANKLRKAAGKKIKELMASIRDRLITGAKPRIDAGEITQKEVEEIWEQIETFAGYGFCKCIDIKTPVWCNGRIVEVGSVRPEDRVYCFDGTDWVETDVIENHDHGILPAFEVTFSGGEIAVCSLRHKFETENGKVPLWSLISGGEVLCAKEPEKLDLHFLSMGVSNQESVGISQVCESDTSHVGVGGMCCVQGMWGEVPIREGLPEASQDLSEGNRSGKQQSKTAMLSESFKGSVGADGNVPQREGFDSQGGIWKGIANDGCAGNSCQDACIVKQDRCFQEEGFVHGNRNFQTERVIGEKDGESSSVVLGTSCGVFSKSEKGENVSEKVESGDMVVGKHFEGLGIRERSPDRLSGKKKVGGLCTSESVDRSGWMLAFRSWIRESKVRRERLQGRNCSREGLIAQSGGGKTPECRVDPVRAELCKGKQEQSCSARVGDCSKVSLGQSRTGCVSTRKVLSARFVGFRRMCDLEVRHRSHNYALANGILSCNSHAIAYGAITTVEMWLKHNFPIQFCTALINNTKLGKKKHGSDNILVDYVNYARRREIAVLGPDVNMSGDEFRIEDNSIRFALGHVKGVATAAKLIETFQPFTGIQDFYDRVKVEDTGDDEDVPEPGNGEASVPEEPEVSEVVKPVKKGSARRPNRKVVENLIAAGAFDRFGTRNEIAMAYWRLRRKPSRKDRLTQKIVDAEEKAKEAALGLVAAQQSGVEKEIKKATKLLSKAEEKIDKAKQAVIEDDKVDEVIADTEDGEEVVKKDKDSPPLDRSEDEWYKAETEVLGTCLSRPVLYKQYEEMIRKEGWYLISEIDQSKKKVMVFGEIIEVRQHISKAGNSMHIVKLSDGIDTMSFFVFQGGWEFFKDNFRTGYIGAISMAKFDDSDNGSRFFDDRGKSIVLKKG